MAEIIPSIIAKSFEEAKQKIVQLEGLANWTQLDVMDGNFVLPVTWNVAEDLENIDGRIKIEAHLMVRDPEEILRDWMDFADRIFIHVESTGHLGDIIEAFDGAPSKLGLAFKIDTPLDVLDDHANQVKYVQLMSIDELGHYGAKFDERVYDRIGEIRERHPDIEISVDGGVSLENAPKLIAAGATNLVVGSAIWNSEDIPGAIKRFQEVVRQ